MKLRWRGVDEHEKMNRSDIFFVILGALILVFSAGGISSFSADFQTHEIAKWCKGAGRVELNGT